MKAYAIPCPHQPPTRGDNTVSVAQDGTATPGATKQFLPPDRIFKRIIYIYIYIYARSIKSKDYIVRSSSFLVQFVIFKNVSIFDHWCHYAFTVTVSWCYVIPRKWWFRVEFHSCWKLFALKHRTTFIYIIYIYIYIYIYTINNILIY